MYGYWWQDWFPLFGDSYKQQWFGYSTEETFIDDYFEMNSVGEMPDVYKQFEEGHMEGGYLTW